MTLLFLESALVLPPHFHWDKSSSFLSLTNLSHPEFKETCLVEILQNQKFFAFGIFCKEDPTNIILLSYQKESFTDFLKKTIKQAVTKRREMMSQYSSVRLIHHENDNLPGLVIEKYESDFFVKSYNSFWDANFLIIKEILECFFKVNSVSVKNFFQARQEKKLPLFDSVFAGKMPNDILEINENNFIFSYETKSTELFPLIDRPLRIQMNQFLQKKNNNSLLQILAIGHWDAQHYFSKKLRESLTLKKIKIQNESFSFITQELRNFMKDPSGKGKFDMILMQHNSMTANTKNKTALFHLYFSLTELLANKGVVCIKTYQKQLIFQVLKQIQNKKKVFFDVTFQSTQPKDFHSNKNPKNKTLHFLTIQLVHKEPL